MLQLGKSSKHRYGDSGSLCRDSRSAVSTDPGWRTGLPIDENEASKPMEPLDRVQTQMDWIIAIMKANADSANLNRKAAIWTAWAVGLSVASSLLGALASYL